MSRLLFSSPRCIANHHVTRTRSAIRSYAGRLESTFSEAELDNARKWLSTLDPDTIPTSICDVSFSRSSGPGGQKVNKTSSKATLRVPTSSLLPLIPEPLHSGVLSSRYYAKTSKDLVIQADDSRKQGENAMSCHRKLLEMIREAGRASVPGETSAEQIERVNELQKAEAAGRRRMKEFQSKKKAARRSGGRDD